jgi:hypothetical protein
MARKRNSNKKSSKRARVKARGKKSASKRPTADSRRTEKVRERRARLSRGLDSARAGIVAESEPERSLEAGQAGDLEGLSAVEDADSESVQELAEEGQDYEAEIIEGVERAENEPEKPMRVRRDEEPRPRPKRQTL